MKFDIRTNGFAPFETEMFHICKLFYENVEMRYSGETDGDLALVFHVETVDPNGIEAVIAGTIEHYDSGRSWNRSAHWTIDPETADTRKRTLRRGVLFVLLQMLEDVTGIEQPWGTLTGVRPTKLLHNLLQRFDRATARRMLSEKYLITGPKLDLLFDIVDLQLQVIPDLYRLDQEVSIYIGIPFCPTKCAYCTFPAYDIRGSNGSVEGFLEGLHYEIRQLGEWLKEKRLGITTIYWGGGTPTSIEAEQMSALFETMHASLPGMDNVRELTVEAGRPDTITPDKIRVMQQWHVDRISINPQSFTQQTLDTIGRHHTVTETIDKFKLSRQMGMNNINMDLIIGLPNEGVEQFGRTLEQTEELLPESLTVHTLSFKRASRMTKNRESFEVAERDEAVDMMLMAEQWTKKHGYQPYYMYRQKNILGNLENVGYALSGKESLYNIIMMEEKQTIIGLGCGAVSKILFPKELDEQGYPHQKVERFPNPKEPSVYNAAYREYVDKKRDLLNEAYAEFHQKAF